MSDRAPLESSSPQKTPAKGGFLTNLLCNIIIPVVILTRFNQPEALGPVWSVVVALAFPIGYGLWEMRLSGKVNPFSVLGVISVILTGGISLLELDPKYIAIKEAAIPAIIGLAVIISQKSHHSVVKLLIFNEQLLRLDRVHAALAEHNNEQAFERQMSVVTYIVASSFFLSSALNYGLAKWVVKSAPGTPEFAAELGRMTALSYPVIVIPSMLVLFGAIFFLFSQLKRLTHLSMDELVVDQQSEKSS